MDALEELNTTVLTFLGSMPASRATAANAMWLMLPSALEIPSTTEAGSAFSFAISSLPPWIGESALTLKAMYSLMRMASGVTSAGLGAFFLVMWLVSNVLELTPMKPPLPAFCCR
ncbi:hypothetical protein D3C83_32940 [compost metagenome]